MLRCKAEEAGSVYVEVDPRIHAPSQTCHISGRREKKPLSQRWHTLPSGERIGRDENAARVILQLSLGWEPSRRGEEDGQ
ncbi:zinc ribbon domain-containing protein, partial [Arthrospira platensis SPKY1]|nr:zinc ribbon domain-containing protein [Arthrospira platensis SPKY1]